MSVLEVKEALSEDGNINLHNQQGVQFILGFEQQDVRNRAYWFEVSNGFRKQLLNGTNSDQKILNISPGELNQLLDKLYNYVIVDETDPLHELILEGSITVRGF